MNVTKLGLHTEKVVLKLIELATTDLPLSVENALMEAMNNEESSIARNQLSSMLSNIKIAKEKRIPICQDTGIQMFHIKLGEDFPLKADLPSIIRKAVKQATLCIPLRPNAVHPISRVNSGDNTGIQIPYIEWEVDTGDCLELTVIPKGFGGENMSRLKMLTPGQGLKALKKFLIKSVVFAGGKPCPPTIIGIGLGSGIDGVLRFARKAMLRPISSRNEDPVIAEMEIEFLNLINETGIGPMGLGGRTTSLAVNIEVGHTHTASLPAAIVFQCWAARSSKAKIYTTGDVEFVSHDAVEWEYTI